jgi:hypothetical protein
MGNHVFGKRQQMNRGSSGHSCCEGVPVPWSGSPVKQRFIKGILRSASGIVKCVNKKLQLQEKKTATRVLTLSSLSGILNNLGNMESRDDNQTTLFHSGRG